MSAVTQGRLLVGTSGFSFKEWIGPFYPEGTTTSGMLPYYASRLGAVELNYTFRQNPVATTLRKWVRDTPAGFVFAPKANQGITHYARLRNTGERLERFYSAMVPLGDRLGPVLYQCHPHLKYDPRLLAGFLADLAAVPEANGRRAAMEFRHESWFTGEAAAQLTEAGVALCVADTDESPTGVPQLSTAPGFVYLRLRKSRYSRAALRDWSTSIGSALTSGADVYAFLKHDDAAAGPLNALALARKVPFSADSPRPGVPAGSLCRPTSRRARPRRP